MTDGTRGRARIADNGVELVTFGCRLNSFESEVMRRNAFDDALTDTVIVNTCAVTAEAVRQARQAIRKARRARPLATIIVTGCAAQIEPEHFAAMPEVNRVVGNATKLKPGGLLPRTADGPSVIQVDDIMAVTETADHLAEGFVADPQDRARAFIQVQNGCDHRCTFCIIPFGRGPSRSVPAGAVIEAIAHSTDAGFAEIVLTGVDLTAYGSDLPGKPPLGVLVARILRHVPALKRLRLSSIDPVEADETLIQLIAEDARIMPHLHLSLQSGDDLILKRMKRRHSRDQAIAFCEGLRRLRPEIVFGADLIAGFPTETEAMFERSLALIDDCGLVYTHVFPFSARPSTPAARMPALDGAIVRDRARRLRDKGAAALRQFLKGQVGTQSLALVESERRARTDQYAPVVLDAPALPGSVARLRITGAQTDHLTGSVAL